MIGVHLKYEVEAGPGTAIQSFIDVSKCSKK